MIVPMKHLTLLCVAPEGEKALESLRELGCVHLDLSAAASPEFAEAKGGLADAERAVRILEKAAKDFKVIKESKEIKVVNAPNDSKDLNNLKDLKDPKGRKADIFEAVRNADLTCAVLKADAERAALVEQADALRQTIRIYGPFGDFDPALAQRLRSEGVPVKLAQGPGQPPERKAFFAETLPEGWSEVPLPAERLSETQAKLSDVDAQIAGITASLAAASGRVSAITDRYPRLKDKVAFAAAQDVLATQGAVSYIEGWVPVDALPRLRAKAVTKAWGLLVRDARADETPPTLIRPPKLFRPVAALFKGLGIAPGYTEADVSVPFMCYFSLFFAMLVGDGGYGAIVLALTLWGWRKTKPKEGMRHRPALVRSWLTLLTVFSSATVVWGILSNTWFGANLPFAKEWATVKWLGEYNNMMLLCFTIGVSHLVLARVWNGVCKINDTTCLAEFGWAGVLVFMYCVVNWIVGIFSGIPSAFYWVFGVSLALVFGFTVKPSELKTRGAELGMLPLNVMSALGDIISYVRLFAVGLASVKVAENFNGMAMGLDMPLWLKIVPMVLILLIGHGLNFAMAGLSILVHAVRLNTLEFSNHKGVSWSGYDFSPFRRNS